MPKLQTLEELSSLGFNTPNLLLAIKRGDDLDVRLGKWRDFSKSYQGDKVSIRTERDGEFTTPHMPNYPMDDAYEKVPSLIRAGYNVYLFDPIDPSECLRRGTICFNGSRLVIEYLEGPGTVRDIEHKPDVISRQLEPTRHQGIPGMAFVVSHEDPCHRIIEAYCSELDRFRNQILEWSIYRNPVGKMKQREIYWELRRWR